MAAHQSNATLPNTCGLSPAAKRRVPPLLIALLLQLTVIKASQPVTKLLSIMLTLTRKRAANACLSPSLASISMSLLFRPSSDSLSSLLNSGTADSTGSLPRPLGLACNEGGERC